MLTKVEPMQAVAVEKSFSHPDWIFELKYDGFRMTFYLSLTNAIAVTKAGKSWERFVPIARRVQKECLAREAVLDGEVVCLNKTGRPMFYDLMRNRPNQYYFAFDLLWADGEDLRHLPLIERKQRLRNIIPADTGVLRYVDHIEGEGESFFQDVCEQDLEGVVAKYKFGHYGVDEKPPWLKIKNKEYSQNKNRWRWFQNGRDSKSKKA